jgi:response regulator RpfG family c-di-GMP phosphodiesterase
LEDQKPRILLVDDEPQLLELCSEFLSGIAGSISTARDVPEALARLGQASFDLVITDMRMPGGGGREVLKAVAETAPDTDVMVLTGYGSIEGAVECVRLGAVNYLLKPFDYDDLRAAVKKAVRERSMRTGRARAGNLARMLALSQALTASLDAKALIKEFLAQLKSAFDPDGIAFFLRDAQAFGLEPRILIGPYFRDNPDVRAWFESLSASIADRGRPMLLERRFLEDAFGRNSGERLPSSAVGAAVGGLDCRSGAVVALRAGEREPYTLDDLKLLTLFCAHASLCFESQRAFSRLKSANDDLVFSLVHAVEAKDTYTRGHSERVSRYAVKLGRHIGLTDRELEVARTAGVLHDIGKIGVPDNILNKAGALGGDELPVMRQHPVIARSILGKVESLADVLPVVYHHHERFDGAGYPDGLAGEDIPFLARLVSVVDGFEAMTSDRAYHQARNMEKARNILEGGAGTQWDADLVKAWLELMGKP